MHRYVDKSADEYDCLHILVQYYLPTLGEANRTHQPHFELEYLTFPPTQLHPDEGLADSGHEFRYPIPLQHLPRSLRNSSVTESKYAPYGLPDLTISSWVTLAQQLGDERYTKLRKRFREYMYMGGEEG